MYNKLIEGIANALHDSFGEDITVYINGVPQGFKEPCFFIAPISFSRRKMISSLYDTRNSFDIHYFPAERKAELLSAADKLMCEMEYIKLENGDLLRGIDMNFNIVDNVLHFFVRYDFHIMEEKEYEKMSELIIGNERIR